VNNVTLDDYLRTQKAINNDKTLGHWVSCF